MARTQSKARRYQDVWGIISSFLSGDHPESLFRLLEEFVNIVIHVDACLRYDKDPFKRRSKGSNNFNGTRSRGLRTAEGDLELLIPKMRKGSYFPGWLERWDKLSLGFRSIVANAYVSGVSTRKMTNLFSDLGMDDVDKSLVSRVSSMLEERIDQWLGKRVKKEYGAIWLDATYTHILCEVDESHARPYTKSVAILVAMAIDSLGKQEILHFKICSGESYSNWRGFLEDMRHKGLESAELWISDDHKGLRKALNRLCTGQLHQRCIVHWGRDLLIHIPQVSQYRYKPLIAKVQTAKSVEEFDEYFDCLNAMAREDRYETLMDILHASRLEITTYQQFPPEYWSKLKSTNPIERLNKELRAREKSINLFTTYTSIKQIYGYILMIQDQAWAKAGHHLIIPTEEENLITYMRHWAHPKDQKTLLYASSN
ncbi:MAG TPA: IS256 family transposase [Candidatus Cloacimonadota bacterium]|nr:IS256 family transposase [Candidatus Cloacimonadota bacterium]